MLDTEKLGFKIICPFCNKPYTAKMKQDLISSQGCDSCGYGSLTGTITITCDHCKKVVYKKEIDE